MDAGHNGANGRGNGPGNTPEGVFPLPTAKLGLWIFLAVVTVLFSALISAYVVRMGLSDWVALPEPALLWVNTGFLILSSVAFQWAFVAAKKERRDHVQRGLWGGGVFGTLFVLGQILAWQQLNAAGHFLAVNPANTFFYLITALHGLHMLGGLVAWVGTTLKMRQKPHWDRLPLTLEVCAIYWHFLLFVWLILFGLMWLT